MKLLQYSHFVVRSTTLTPDQMTQRFGMEPDETRLMGSRHPGRPNATVPSLRKPVPRTHMWDVRCEERNLNVGAQIEKVLERLGPSREPIREAVSAGDVAATLSVARMFGDEDGDNEIGLIVDEDGKTVRERVWLFGWHLDASSLEFLTYVGAELDVDEYDMLGGVLWTWWWRATYPARALSPVIDAADSARTAFNRRFR
jgi:Domain of unknown function (DUF4279)